MRLGCELYVLSLLYLIIKSCVQFDLLVSMETAGQLVEGMDDWKTNQWATFVMLSESTDPSRVNVKSQDPTPNYQIKK